MNRRQRTIDQKFWENVDLRGPDDCWNWMGHIQAKGYGVAMLYKLKLGAHVLSWIINYSDLPGGLMVCHRCDNRKCVNPKHLFLGTAHDNNVDMDAKGRRLVRDRHPFAKLSWEAVAVIRVGKESNRALARRFGVAHSTVKAVRAGRTWRAEQ